MLFQYLQRWGLNHFPGQHMQGLRVVAMKMFSLICNLNLPCHILRPFPLSAGCAWLLNPGWSSLEEPPKDGNTWAGPRTSRVPVCSLETTREQSDPLHSYTKDWTQRSKNPVRSSPRGSSGGVCLTASRKTNCFKVVLASSISSNWCSAREVLNPVPLRKDKIAHFIPGASRSHGLSIYTVVLAWCWCIVPIELKIHLILNELKEQNKLPNK